MKADIRRPTLHLRHFDPEVLAQIVNGALRALYPHPRHLQRPPPARGVRSFSIDTARYNLSVRACGAFPRQTMAVTYFRSLTEPACEWI